MSTRDFQYDTGGLTDLVVVLYFSGGTTMVNASTGALIAATSANLNTAAIATSDATRAGQYRYTIPAGLVTAGIYDEVFYRKRTNGTTLVQADTVAPYGPEAIGQFGWDGADVIGANDLDAQLAEILLNTASAKDDAHAIFLKLPSDNIAGVSDVSGGGGGTGTGDVLINHDYGGTDALRVTHSGSPIDGATIYAYEASAYGPGADPDAQTFTGSDGRWTQPMHLDAGSYKLVVSKPAEIVDKVIDLTVT